MVKKCPSCGYKNRDDALFCTSCAASLEDTATPRRMAGENSKENLKVRTKEKPDLAGESPGMGEEVLERPSGGESSATGATPSESVRQGLWEAERREDRARLYKRDDVRRLLGWLLRANEKFTPVKSPASGEYIYSGTEFGLDDVLSLLHELESSNILQRKVVDTSPTCPACQHGNFYVGFACPFCQQTALEQGDLLEHYSCAYSDFETNFRSGTDLVCPKCHRFLKVVGTDYRKVTQAYRCMSCAKFFGTPKLEFSCRVCGRLNAESEMALTPAYSYALNKTLKNEVIANVSLDAKITEILKKGGYKVAMPMRVVGLSGVTHSFDLGAKNEGENKEFVLDMVSAVVEVGPRDIIDFFAKVYDTKPKLAILVALPRISVEAQRLAAMYGVRAIEAKDPDEAARRLAPLLEITPLPDEPQPSTKPTNEPEVPNKSDYASVSFAEHMKKYVEERILTEQEISKTPASEVISDEVSPDEKLRQARHEMRRMQEDIEVRGG